MAACTHLNVNSLKPFLNLKSLDHIASAGSTVARITNLVVSFFPDGDGIKDQSEVFLLGNHFVVEDLMQFTKERSNNFAPYSKSTHTQEGHK